MAISAYVVIGSGAAMQGFGVQLHTYTWQVKKGQKQGNILVNGASVQPTKLTKGRGQGTTMEFCCYFTHMVNHVPATATAPAVPASATPYFFWSTSINPNTFLPQTGVQIFIGASQIAAAQAAVAAAQAAVAAAQNAVVVQPAKNMGPVQQVAPATVAQLPAPATAAPTQRKRGNGKRKAA